MKQVMMSLSFLMLLACAQTDPTQPFGVELSKSGSPPTESVPFDEPFALAYGEERHVGQDGLTVGFHEVRGDSRCPLEVECFWEGEGRIGVWLSEPGADTVYLEPIISGYVLKEHTGSHHRVYSERYVVSLLQLDPYPKSPTESMDVEDYLAWLSVSLKPMPPVE